MPGSFFDTNVIAYLVSNDTAKADRAERLTGAGGTISVQVLNELANVARRRFRLSWPETARLLGLVRGLLAVAPVTIETHAKGMALAQRYQLPIYDALIAAAAIISGCDLLWSEDFQDGMLIDECLRVRNPFTGE